MGRTGLSERRFREVFSSLPMSLLRSSGCLRSNEAERGWKILGFPVLLPVPEHPDLGPGPHPTPRLHCLQCSFPGRDAAQTTGPKFTNKTLSRHPW